jgi:hypothetical protein
MASAARSAANRLNAPEGTEPRSRLCKRAMQRCPLRHLPAELGSNRVPIATGQIPAKIAHWDSRPDLLNEISGRESAESQFQAAGDPP